MPTSLDFACSWDIAVSEGCLAELIFDAIFTDPLSPYEARLCHPRLPLPCLMLTRPG